MEPILSFRTTLLCVLAGIALAGLMIATHHGPGITPLSKPSTAESRNETRKEILNRLSDALSHYIADHGKLPVTLSQTSTEICSSRGANCQTVNLVDLNFLVNQGDYIRNIDSDPSGGPGRWTTGFAIASLPDGRIRLTAPRAELGSTITVTK